MPEGECHRPLASASLLFADHQGRQEQEALGASCTKALGNRLGPVWE